MLGKALSRQLLESSIMTYCCTAPPKLLDPDDALGRGGDDLEVFANIALWPVEQELLIAADFDSALQMPRSCQLLIRREIPEHFLRVRLAVRRLVVAAGCLTLAAVVGFTELAR